MATIVFNRMAQLLTDYVLGASGTVTPPSAWTMGLSTTVVGSGANMARNSVWSATISGSNVNEIGATTAAGYARQTIAKSINTGSVDWNLVVRFNLLDGWSVNDCGSGDVRCVLGSA